MERPWSYEAPEGNSSEIGGRNKKLFGGEGKFCAGVKENRLRGERISRLATVPFLYTFPPLWNHSLARKTDTDLFIMAPLPRPKKITIALSRHVANTLSAATGEKTRKQ